MLQSQPLITQHQQHEYLRQQGFLRSRSGS